MPTVSLYDPATGRIKMSAQISEDSHAHLTQEQEPRIDGAFEAAAWYVRDGTAVARPANPATLSGMQLASLPAPCTITINGTDYPCADTTADLTLGPGAYVLTVTAFPYLDATFNVRV